MEILKTVKQEEFTEKPTNIDKKSFISSPKLFSTEKNNTLNLPKEIASHKKKSNENDKKLSKNIKQKPPQIHSLTRGPSKDKLSQPAIATNSGPSARGVSQGTTGLSRVGSSVAGASGASPFGIGLSGMGTLGLGSSGMGQSGMRQSGIGPSGISVPGIGPSGPSGISQSGRQMPHQASR